MTEKQSKRRRKQADQNAVQWDPQRIKALREYMNMTQQELADELEVRQQTISEWETGLYTPRRSTQKYLSMVAERAGFQYQVNPSTESDTPEEEKSEGEPERGE